MRFKRIALAALLLVVAATVTPLLLLQPWKQPSSELKLLRDLEIRLQLPEPEERREIDRGTYTDKSGNNHNVRSITRSYTDASAFDKIATESTKRGWKQQYSIKDGTNSSVMLVNHFERACMELRTVKHDDGLPADSIILLAASDDACNGYFAVY